MNWYHVEQGKQAGPLSEDQFQELIRLGKIKDDTLVWREGMGAWTPLRQVKGELPPALPASTTATPFPAAAPGGETVEAVCTECGGIFPKENMIRYGEAHVCAGCKPAFVQKLAEGAAIHTGEMHYAGFWIRVAARIVDGLILGVPFMAVFLVVFFRPQRPFGEPRPVDFLPSILQLGFAMANVAYQIFFLGKYGATLGKMACKLQVVTSEGGRISYGRATGRVFAEMLSGIICYIGYIIVGFDSQKRALHDHICNTRVVYK